MAETPFTRKHEYEAIRVDYYGNTIDLRVEDEADVVWVNLTTDEAKLLRKQLKDAITATTKEN